MGYAGLAFVAGPPFAEAEIHTIGVDPAYQRRGIGRELLRGLLAVADAGAATVFLEVRTDNEAARGCTRTRDSRWSACASGTTGPAAPTHTRCGGSRQHDRSRYRDLLRRDRRRGGARRRRAGAVTLLANEVASSVEEHARFGGVVPEVASRAHLQAMVPDCAPRARHRRGAAGATSTPWPSPPGPGLTGALLVGVAAAKAYAAAWDVPLYGVNHLAAHVAVDTLQHGPLPPCLALLVSGGHSSLLDVPDLAGPVTPLGATIDDAAGEAFDKVARLLGLPFPGGPHIDRVARDGDPAAVAFPRGLTGPRDAPFDFSFSGLKTAVARHVEALERAGTPVPVADVAASFQEAVVDVLTAKAVRAARERGMDTVLLGGGVAANSRLRALAQERCAAAGIALRVPRPGLCTDNGAMVAALGAHLLAGGAAAVVAATAGRLVAPGHHGARHRRRTGHEVPNRQPAVVEVGPRPPRPRVLSTSVPGRYFPGQKGPFG